MGERRMIGCRGVGFGLVLLAGGAGLAGLAGLAGGAGIAGLAACGGRSLGSRQDGGRPDAAPRDAAPRDALVRPDGAVPADATVPMDSGPWPDGQTDPCSCPEDAPVYQYHECVPPLQYGCEAVTCALGDTDCGPSQSCVSCAAAACCHCAACLPACIYTGPAMGPLPEYLKIWPTYGTAGAPATIRIEGFPFYVGALYYLARVGSSGDLFQQGGSTCSFEVTAPGRPPGMDPVWVSQYGGGEPWVLAGFYTWSGGVYPECVQPGYPCGPDQGCCETIDVPMTCQDGRCRRP